MRVAEPPHETSSGRRHREATTKAFLFDLDGTLAASEVLKARALASARPVAIERGCDDDAGIRGLAGRAEVGESGRLPLHRRPPQLQQPGRFLRSGRRNTKLRGASSCQPLRPTGRAWDIEPGLIGLEQ